MKTIFRVLLCIFLNYKSAQKCQKNAELYLEKPYQPVYDIIQINTRPIPLHTPDFLLALTGFCVYIYSYLGQFSLQNFDINIDCLFYCFLLRALVMRLTIIPSCAPRQKKRNLFIALFNSSHDLIYSGHTTCFIFFGKIIDEPFASNNIYITSRLIQFIFPISLILARQHYTIDVFMAMIVYNYFLILLNNI